MEKVSLNIEALANKLGYDKHVITYHISELYQEEINKWLRDKYNCFVTVHPEAYKSGINWCVQVLFYNPDSYDCWDNNSTCLYGDNGEFKTYEDALSFGLEKALQRIISPAVLKK